MPESACCHRVRFVDGCKRAGVEGAYPEPQQKSNSQRWYQIAAEEGAVDRTLYKWKKREEFIARVNAMVQAYSGERPGDRDRQQSAAGRDPEAIA